MIFKRTAALGLSALLIGSNMVLPAAYAGSVGLSEQNSAQQQLSAMVDNHLPVTTVVQRQPVVQHPIQPKSKQQTDNGSVLGFLNPFQLLFPAPAQPTRKAQAVAHPVKPGSVAKTAASIPVSHAATPLPVSVTKAVAQAEKGEKQLEQPETKHLSAKSGHHKQNKKAQKLPVQKLATQPTSKDTPQAKSAPIQPVVTINPVMAVALNSTSPKNSDVTRPEGSVITAAAPSTVEAAPLPHPDLISNTAETPVALFAADGDTVRPTIVPSANQQINPNTIQPAEPSQPGMGTQPSTVKPTTINVAQSPKAQSANKAAKSKKARPGASPAGASPLERMMSVSQGAGMHYAPGLDSGAPAINLFGTDSSTGVKVLKSGISQNMTSIELPIGKAEVLYLSRPATRVSVSNPDVAAAVIISPTQIQLTGKSVGVANLLVWSDMNSPDHTVVDISVHRDVSVLVNQLKYVDPGIQIAPLAAEDTVILTGQAETRETAQMAIEMAKAFFAKGGGIGAGPMPGGGSGNGPNSQAPGSAQPGTSTNVINLIKIKGEPSTKLELVRQRMLILDPNIRIEVVPGPDGSEKVILTGRVPTASVASKALNLASVFYGQPGMKMVTTQGGNDFVRMSGTTSTSSSTSSSSSGGGGSSLSGGSTGLSSNINMLQGSIMTDASGNVISMLEIAQKPQIRCSIKFLELNKTALNALGGTVSGVSGATKVASWSGVQSAAPGKGIAVLDSQSPPGSTWGTTASRTGGSWNPTAQTFTNSFREVYQNGITQAFTINNQIAGAIQALQERRQVRTLAEPTLTMLSGEQGSFLAGGEIPIAFVGGQGQVSIQYKEFGIRLNLMPNVTDDGKIQMQVSPEISSLDAANGVSTNSISVPAFVSRRMNTTLLVEQGQSFILAGLYSQQDTDSMSRFPGLGSVPVLGTFFRNKWKNKNSSEMVVVIKPEVIYTPTGNTGSSPLSQLPMSKPQVSQQ